MSETTGGLPLMAQTQNSRYLTFNELSWALNVLQTGVLDRDLTTPPGSPSEGDAYIVDSPATGAWAGHENEIAFFFDGIWNFLAPELVQGNGIYVYDEGLRVRWNTGSPTGYEILTVGSDASTVSYTPAVAADWDGSADPGNADDAFDQLAERVKDLEGAGTSNAFGTIAVSGQSDVVADSASDTLTLVAGSNITLTTSAGGDSVTIAASGGGGSGKVAQIVQTQTGAVATGTTTIPLDDTIPQNTEGNEYMSLSITPTSATNKLKIDVVWHGASSAVAAQFIAAALFQDSTASALACGLETGHFTDDNVTINFSHVMTAGTTSSTTFKVRAGANGAGTTTFNGRASARLFGGALASSITITEYVP